jgi:hypothetical protein
MKKIIIALTILLVAASVATADTIYLRDGRQVHGTLLGFINGRFVVRVDRRYIATGSTGTGISTGTGTGTVSGTPVRNPEGQRDSGLEFFRPGEVERIEIEGRADELRYENASVQVPLESNWIDTGIDLRRNEKVQVSATGTILAGRNRITPDGLRSNDPNSPLPRAAEGMLIGAVGDERDAPIFELGSAKEFVADRDGRLYLTANRGNYSDAHGNFSVQIRRERDLTALDDDTTGRGRRRGTGLGRSRDRLPGDGRRIREPREISVEVAATSRGTDAGVEVRAGDQITFTATGTIVAGRRIGSVGPEGAATSGFGSIVGTRPVPSSGAGALIAYIRTTDGQSSTPFLIGSSLTYTATADGRLYLAVNDDNYSDNSGSFTVKIRH